MTKKTLKVPVQNATAKVKRVKVVNTTPTRAETLGLKAMKDYSKSDLYTALLDTTEQANAYRADFVRENTRANSAELAADDFAGSQKIWQVISGVLVVAALAIYFF